MQKQKHNKGFLLISLIIVIAIIAILFVVMYGKSHNGGPTTAQTYHSDIQSAQQVTNFQSQQNLDLQNQVNSAGSPSLSTGQRAIQQAQGLQTQNAAPPQ